MDGDTASTSLFLVSARHDLIAGRAYVKQLCARAALCAAALAPSHETDEALW